MSAGHRPLRTVKGELSQGSGPSIVPALEIVATQLDLSRRDELFSSLSAVERNYVSDAKSGTQAFNVWQRQTFQQNNNGLTYPNFVETQLLITNASASGVNNTFNGSSNQVIAIEPGLPMYQRARVTIGTSLIEENALPYKSTLIQNMIADEAAYADIQGQDDGIWIRDKQGFDETQPLFWSTAPTGVIVSSSGTQGEYLPIWDMTTFTGTTGIVANLVPFLAQTSGAGNLTLPQPNVNSVIFNRYYNKGLARRCARTLAVDSSDGTIMVRNPLSKIFGFFKTWQRQVLAGGSLTIDLTFNNVQNWLKTLNPTVLTPSVSVSNSRMWYTSYTPQPGLDAALEAELKSGRQYVNVYRAFDALQQSLAAGAGGNVSFGALRGNARRIWVYFMTQTRDNTQTSLSTCFPEQFYPSQLYINIGNRTFPALQYSPIDTVDLHRMYQDYIRTTDHYETYGTASQSLSYSQWAVAPIYGFKIELPYNQASAGQNFSIQVNFPTATQPSSAIYVNAVFEYERKVIVAHRDGQMVFGQPV